jgi:phosphoribosylformylglycinamidine (FGAM) synthase PurS component
LLGIDTVSEIRMGRTFRFVVEAVDAAAAQIAAEDLSHRLLANPVIQRSDVSVTPLHVSI